ncbi:hypothetical protein [Halobacillus litoralis]|uniref:Uncharacterized protein n=1 Tax=Halobacillus litoralis TaxID=45668 RepID=A0A410MEE7_9BACI|nr:hypothetical protein [Halobacillus litoralis]QAS53070.1 hypothetical protein HLI_13170 [Halobacillus litoralis]
MNDSKTVSIYYWIRKKRWKKKKQLYQASFHLVFDYVVFFYMAVFSIIFLIMIYDWIQRFLPTLIGWEEPILEWGILIPFILLVKACMNTFTDPGLRFTSSELQLGILPHSRKALVKYLVLEKQLIHSFVLLLTALTLGLLTPLSLAVVLFIAFFYILLLPLAMTVQWKLFSQSIWFKFSALLLSGGLLAFLRLSGQEYLWLGAIFILLLILFLFKSRKKIMDVSWMKIVEINDARVWNMMLISKMTNVTIKPPKRYGFFQNYIRHRRKSEPSIKAVRLYERIWIGHLQSSFSYIWKTVVVGIALLLVLPWQVEWVILVTLPIAVFVYVEMAASIFEDFFHGENIFRTMPTEEELCVKGYLKWMRIGLIPYSIAFIVSGVLLTMTWWVLVIQLICITIWVLFDLRTKVNERMKSVNKEPFFYSEWRRMTGYILVSLGLYHPIFMLGILVLIRWEWLYGFSKRN